MKISNILSTIAILALVSGCTNKIVEQDVSTSNNIAVNNSIQKQVIKDVKIQEVKNVEKIPTITLKANEIEFLEILKNDKYASICGSEADYQNILQLDNPTEKSKKLEELFYEYTKNLSNSCINQSAFKKELRKRKYRDANQDYRDQMEINPILK